MPSHAASATPRNASDTTAFQIYSIFALSGASALIYQVIWARWLGLVFGNTTLSISIVLGCFMLGLALGSALVAGRIRRANDPMRWYALAELGIGIYALLCRPITVLADRTFTLLMSMDSSMGYSLFIRAVLSAAVLLIPTMLMGTTLPLLSDFFNRGRTGAREWRVGLLYAANTLGAAVGILAAGFVLIEFIGVFATTLVAAGLNFLVAWLGYKLSLSARPAEKSPSTSPARKLDPIGRFALCAVAWSGALALGSEVLWTRTLETIVGNSTYAFSSIVVVYLSGIALGSWAMSLRVNRLKAIPAWLAAMLLGMGLWTIAAIGLFGQIATAFVQFNGQMVPLWVIFVHYVEIMSVLIPLAVISGACFPLATRIIDPESQDASGALVAKVYAWNTFGALAGSAAAGFLIAPFWDYIDALHMIAALYCAGAVAACTVLVASRGVTKNVRGGAFALGALASAGLLLSAARTKDYGRYARDFEARHPPRKITFHKPGLQGVTSVIQTAGNPRLDMLHVNGSGMTVKTTDTKMMAHLPMLLHPRPENVLVICLGMGTTFRSALSYGHRVTVVELVKEVVDALDIFDARARELKSDPRSRIVVNDGRNFLKLTHDKFDVITIDPPPPIDAAGVNSLYSKEFLELAKAHLKKGGLIAHWVPYPGSGGVDSEATATMLMATFAQTFPYTYFHASARDIGVHLVGSMEPIDISGKSLQEKLGSWTHTMGRKSAGKQNT